MNIYKMKGFTKDCYITINNILKGMCKICPVIKNIELLIMSVFKRRCNVDFRNTPVCKGYKYAAFQFQNEKPFVYSVCGFLNDAIVILKD
ncbi:hypothetical protein [Lacrimispora sp.]|jgi:hypothetical protein|uniref:hypothetical protein n=1 Tax=Lacrimispora sp. TaxID=2719234 RepID=UPI002899870B|nr:hypothetical protein [Lacrimispora sp.]